MKKVEGITLEDLWINTCNECKSSSQENLILHGIFNISEINSKFIQIHNPRALQWRSEEKPKELIINHGEYINAAGNGINFIKEELKRKPTGNRACFSLIKMNDIINSGDTAIPSFMVLQFGISNEDEKKLLVTAYFRALECKQFLPINLAEISTYIKDIYTTKPNLTNFELNIISFRVQYIDGFYCLNKSKFDIYSSSEYTLWLLTDKKQIIDAIKDKISSVESIVFKEGLMALVEAITVCGEKSKIKDQKVILKNLETISKKMDDLQSIRQSTSIFKGSIEELTNVINELFQKVIENLEECL